VAEPEDILYHGREILIRMVAISKNVAIYPPNHPMVREPASEICELLKTFFSHRPRISFNIVNSEIYFRRELLRNESIQYSDFIKRLTKHGINSLYFEPDITPESVAMFFRMIDEAGKNDSDPESLKNCMAGSEIRGIDFERLVAFDMVENTYRLAQETETSTAARNSYDQAAQYLENVEKDILGKKHIDTNALQSVVSSLISDFLHDKDAIMQVLSIKNYDEYLFHHSINVAIVSLLIAGKLSLEEKMMRAVGVAGLLHDIGKIKIPRELINKPAGLNENEWIIIRRHPIEGAQILMRHENLGELPVLAAMEHHAGYDLSGYPTLKRKEYPHAIARIVSIADVYEAMTANRSYRSARTIPQAVKVLLDGAGRQFDPMLLKLFLNAIGVFPPGSTVQLKNGERAIVIEPNEDKPFFPKVRTIGDKISDLNESPLIDTSENPAQYAVVGVADSEKV